MIKIKDNAKTSEQTRPTCINYGCNKPVHSAGRTSTGLQIWRPYCGRCHKAVGGRGTYAEGVTPVKKTYCENKDGRLGFKCTATIIDSCQLDLDHIDGHHYNNTPENIQTICKNCHSLKTKLNGDSRSYSTIAKKG